MKNKAPPKEKLLTKRVFFKNNTIRNDFFNELKIQLGSWTKVIKYFNTYKSKLERARYGINSISYKEFLEFASILKKKEKRYFKQNIILKDKNWGNKKGGKSTYKKHIYIFEQGRKIGSKSTKYKFNLKTPLTNKLSELIGAFIGDGFTNKYGGVYVTQYTGNAKLEVDYMTNVIKPLIKDISPNSNPIISQTDNTIRMTIYSKEFYDLLTYRFGLLAGKKCYDITIPSEIINSKDNNIVKSCIRGIYDTDGCIFWDKRNAYKKPYPRIHLVSASKGLIKQIYIILKEFDLNPRLSTNYNKYVIQINGLNNVQRFVKEIGFSNKKHIDKIRRL